MCNLNAQQQGIYRSYEVQSFLTLIPCLDAAHRYSLFPIPYSLFPKMQKLCIS
ncbi:MAG: hypothetical protein F6K56_32710 [Moorea sp. SIO3G5]|nr:hypothetical protein [Moorena sp. SIO3G5]